MTKRTSAGSKLDELYIIGLPSHPGIVKIGRSGNARERLPVIQVWSPFPLVILHAEPHAGKYERHIHEMFADLRTHGEWFRFRPGTDPVSEVLAGLEIIKSRPPVISGRPRITVPAGTCTRCLYALTGWRHRAICAPDKYL